MVAPIIPGMGVSGFTVLTAGGPLGWIGVGIIAGGCAIGGGIGYAIDRRKKTRARLDEALRAKHVAESQRDGIDYAYRTEKAAKDQLQAQLQAALAELRALRPEPPEPPGLHGFAL